MTVSARMPQTLQPLKATLAAQARVSDRMALTQPRHMDAARRAAQALRDAVNDMHSATIDLAAIHLQQAQYALAEITGDQPTEKLLDAVFSRFCVGK